MVAKRENLVRATILSDIEVRMATWQHELVDPPNDQRARELWLQHAAGFIIFEDVRRYAMDQIDPTLPAEVRAVVQKGIDDTVYGLMMVMEGVSGGLSNTTHTVQIDFIARLAERAKSGSVLSELNLPHSDGMCMGYHDWREGDFGKHPVSRPMTESEWRGESDQPTGP